MTDTFKFDDNFIFGVASSATQIEGGDTNNTWYKWCKKNNKSNPRVCIRACDHWNRVEEDTAILRALRVQSYRMSLEWSRIEPSPGVFSEGALRHYRNEIRLLLSSGIIPFVTLHHFSEPLWFRDAGGWKDPKNAEYFIQYVKYVVENLGDLVSDWVVFNEPNVYAGFGYLFGVFPPGKISICQTFATMTELIKTHIRAYGLIHQIRHEKGFSGETKVGTAMHIRIFDGITFKGKKFASFMSYLFHDLLLDGITNGRLRFPLPKKGEKLERGLYADFLGLNYYTRNIAEFALDPSNFFYKFLNDGSLDKNDLGWDIYPEGIYQACKMYYQRYHLPIYITESGICDSLDNRRPKFIADHLVWLAKAIHENVIVERYYYWSHLDNFEWNEEEYPRFGLYHVDFDTQVRTPRKSAKLYARICEGKELTREMIKEFGL